MDVLRHDASVIRLVAEFDVGQVCVDLFHAEHFSADGPRSQLDRRTQHSSGPVLHGTFQFPFTARRFNSASTASTVCTFTIAATQACSTSRIKSGSLTANSLNVSSMSSGRIRRRTAFCMSGQAENTVRRYCGLAKQFFRAALRRRLIDENPFSDQVAAVRGNAAKFHFISRDDTDKLLKACPDLQWRLILSLARFGGLRCPSEILALNWEDIDWAGKRFTVTRPKTAHHEGGSNRVVPLFPELLAVLTEGKLEATQKMNGNAADSIRGPVITRYRDSTQNLRTTFQKIIKRAGLTTWPKLFQNLRSTRETELAEQFPLQAVTAWMGNSQLVAARHYLQLRDEHFERASLEVTHPTSETPGEWHRKWHRRNAKTGKMRNPPTQRTPQNSMFYGVLRIVSNPYGDVKWALRDSNPRPPRCKRGALTN